MVRSNWVAAVAVLACAAAQAQVTISDPPPEHSFGKVPIGATYATQYFSVFNTGSAPVALGQLRIEAAAIACLAIFPPACGEVAPGDFDGLQNSDGCSNRTLAPGTGCSALVRFVPRADRDSGPLRDGSVDLEVGVIGKGTGPELRHRTLYQDRFIGVVRKGHPLARGEVTRARYGAGRHIGVSRQGADRGPVDAALEPLGLKRHLVAIVGGFATALALARESDLIATVPERHTGVLRHGMTSFDLPAVTPVIRVSMLWHPRMEADAAHRWLRGCVLAACAGGSPGVEESNPA